MYRKSGDGSMIGLFSNQPTPDFLVKLNLNNAKTVDNQGFLVSIIEPSPDCRRPLIVF